MREILFRGKAKNHFRSPWVEGYFMDIFGNGTPYIATITPTKEKEAFIEGETVIPETVGQFTGLTDKNGKKIWEGDIVEKKFMERVYGRYVVNMNKERCGWFPFACGDGCGCCEEETVRVEDCEVIGNIHDNPKLLKEGV